MNELDIRSFWQDVVPRWVLGEVLFFVADRRIADVIGDGPTSVDVIAEKQVPTAMPCVGCSIPVRSGNI